jgi:hypothetical protein
MEEIDGRPLTQEVQQVLRDQAIGFRKQGRKRKDVAEFSVSVPSTVVSGRSILRGIRRRTFSERGVLAMGRREFSPKNRKPSSAVPRGQNARSTRVSLYPLDP